MSGTSPIVEWYIARDGQQHGPLTATELDKFIELGHLRPADLLWKAGFEDWRAAAEVFPPQPPAKPQPFQPVSTAANLASTRPTEPMFAPERNRGTAHLRAGGRGGDGHPSGVQSFDPRDAARPLSHEAASAVTERPSQHPQNQLGGSGNMGSRNAAAQNAAYFRDDEQIRRQPLAPAAASASSHASDDVDDDAFLDDEEPASRSGWLMVAAALFVFVILGAGGLFAYNNQTLIMSFYKDLAGRSKQSAEVAVVRAPALASREAAPGVRPLASSSLSAPKPVSGRTPGQAESRALPELPILKSKLWQFAQREFGEWTQKRIEVVQQLSDQNKPKEEANKYLVDSFVKFRRDNAAVALLASPEKLAQIAEAFVESLRALTEQGAKACYAFISNGEGTPEVAPFYFKPATGAKLEAQMLAILQAIVDGKSTPYSSRQPPSADDFNKLSAELGKRGWTPSDLKLFSDPNALSKAKPEVVCRLVTEWFATQTELTDKGARDQLIAASLRPVIGG